MFSIDNFFSIGGITTNSESSITINGEDVIKSVVYYIDNNEIGESSDTASKYTAKYKMSGFVAGIHMVPTRCKSNFKDIDIKSWYLQVYWQSKNDEGCSVCVTSYVE